MVYLQSVSLLELEGLLNIRFSTSERFTAFFSFSHTHKVLTFCTCPFHL